MQADASAEGGGDSNTIVLVTEIDNGGLVATIHAFVALCFIAVCATM